AERNGDRQPRRHGRDHRALARGRERQREHQLHPRQAVRLGAGQSRPPDAPDQRDHPRRPLPRRPRRRPPRLPAARRLAPGIPASKLGLIGGSYTAAAAISGLACSFFLDRFDRRPALGVAMLGLVAGTAMGALATGMPSLMAARIVAGLFGGPATSLSFSIIADVVPPQRRGTAMGIVMGAFSIASVLGVPAGLEAARHFGWRAPFIGVAGLGLCIAVCAVFLLPPLRGHLLLRKENVSLTHLFRQRNVLLSWTMTFFVMAAGFSIIPNISAYVQYNL